jgi:hypothetical protein
MTGRFLGTPLIFGEEPQEAKMAGKTIRQAMARKFKNDMRPILCATSRAANR